MTSAITNLPTWCNVSLGTKLVAGGVATILVELASIVALRIFAGKRWITMQTYRNWTSAIALGGMALSVALSAFGVYSAIYAGMSMAHYSRAASNLSALAGELLAGLAVVRIQISMKDLIESNIRLTA